MLRKHTHAIFKSSLSNEGGLFIFRKLLGRKRGEWGMSVRKSTRIICLITILCVALSSCVADTKKETIDIETDNHVSQEIQKEENIESIEYNKKFIEDFYSKKGIDSWWEILVIKGAGGTVPLEAREILDEKRSALTDESQVIDYAGYILGYICAEDGLSDMQGIADVLEELSDMQDSETGSFGPINSHIWAMIALDVSGGSYSAQKAVTYLLSQQNPDGGYAFDSSDTSDVLSDPDMTGMALIALSNHGDKEGVPEGIERAIEYLKRSQLPTGGFESYGNDNANSVAIVISGLVAVGEDIRSAKWLQNGNSMLDALMRFKLEDGSFSFLLDSDKYNQMSTYQAFIAIFDLQRGKSIWHSLKSEWLAKVNSKRDIEVNIAKNTDTETTEESKDISSKEQDRQVVQREVSKQQAKSIKKQTKKTKEKNSTINQKTQDQKLDTKREAPTESMPQKPATQNEDKLDSEKENKIKVQVKVTGYGGKVFYSGTVSLEMGNANAFTALKATGLQCKTRAGNSYVSSINGEAEFDHGPTSGWKYKVNGTIPNAAAIDCEIKEGDKVEWWYASTAESTKSGE